MEGLIFIVSVFILYEAIPNYYYRNISNKVIKRLGNKKEIALTFDDGPDTLYTPLLLDLLKKYNVKASFFLVANKMQENVQILDRMVKEGHTVGLHSRSHRSAWLNFPWSTGNDFKDSLKLFKDKGIDIKFFRPPWGTFNLLTQYNADIHKLKTVLWTLEAKDWSARTTVEYIKNQILNNIKPGDIIVLHDSNGALGAPERTIAALGDIIPELKDKDYKFVTLDEF